MNNEELFITYLIHSLISFTFRGTMALLRKLRPAVPVYNVSPYRNRSNYWSTWPLQVKSVNGSIAIWWLRSSLILERLRFTWHELRFTHHSKNDAQKQIGRYWLLTCLQCLLTTFCIIDLPPTLRNSAQSPSMASRKSKKVPGKCKGNIHLRWRKE